MSDRSNDELVIYRQDLEGADFSGRRPRLLSIAESRLTRCNFSEIQAKGDDLGGGITLTVYRECVFDRARFIDVIPGNALFIDCSFREVHIKNFFCNDAQFVGCVFSGILRSVVFNAICDEPDLFGRSRNEYRDNDFTAAVLDNVGFRGGIDLTLQRLPTGDDYLTIWNAQSVLPTIRNQVELWPEKELRDKADPPLWILESNCSRGQRDLFVSRSFLDLGRAATTSRARLAELCEIAARSNSNSSA